MALDLQKSPFATNNYQPSATVGAFSPVLSTTFPKTTQPGSKITPVVTSKVAEDHIKKIGDTLNQSTNDIAAASQANAQNTAVKTQQEDAKKQQDIENRQNEQDPTMALMQALGEEETVGQDTIQANRDANKMDEQYLTTVGNAIDEMNAGTYPLSQTEKASIENVRGAFVGAFREAENMLKNQKAGTTKLNARGGLQMYSPQEAISRMARTVQDGQARIGEINSKLIDAQNKLTIAFQENNFKTATSLYNKISDTIKARNDEINDINKSIADQRKELMDVLKEERKAEAEVQKELTKTKSDVLLKLATSGNAVTPEMRQMINNATSTDELFAAAGDALYSEDDKLDAQYKRLQMDKIKQDMVLDVQKFNLDKLKDENDNMMDPNLALAYAAEYAANGKIPTGLPKNTFGIIAQVAKEMPKTPGQVVSVSTGVAPAGDDAYQSALGSLYSATQLAKQLKELDEKRYQGIISGTLGKVFGSEDQARYLDLRSQIVDLLSRARSGAALTPSEEERYGSMLPGRFSDKLGIGVDSDVKIDNFVSALTEDAKNKASSKGWAINGVSKVKAGGNEYTVGDVIDINGMKGRINADGTVTQIQ